MNKLCIALGGNAIISANQKGTAAEQFSNVSQTTAHLADLVKAGYQLTITHGNGPQIGNLLLQHHAGREQVPPLPMDICGAQSQGQIGYMIQQTLQNHIRERGLDTSVASIITQVAVDAHDPAFSNPTKPIGPFYDSTGADQLREQGFAVIEDAGRGYRRVVPSPIPTQIIELKAITQLINQGSIVITAGGGGIPVVRKDNSLEGIEAVIDKDRAGALLARSIGADRYIILTDVEQVFLHFNTPDAQPLASLTLSQAKEYCDQGHFAAGSMLPKIQACIEFVQKTGKEALITHPFTLPQALDGTTGTRIQP